ncbi:hypothetical protein [Kutzneria kofuensis]|uniref:hypothetical protein n=1 Tax=Kutzneria kofuensis TaxID=103725 RepID=UPI0031E57C22
MITGIALAVGGAAAVAAFLPLADRPDHQRGVLPAAGDGPGGAGRGAPPVVVVLAAPAAGGLVIA